MKRLKKSVLLLVLVFVVTVVLSPSVLAIGTEDIRVQLGDEMIQFGDAQPVFQDGRAFVPVRALLEALGAAVTYDKETEKVTAVRGDTVVELYIGQTTIYITKDNDSQKRLIETGVASFIKGNQLLAPVRVISEAFGCIVGWDSYERTVLILDAQRVLDRAEDYTLMDKMLSYSNKYSQSAFAVTGSFDVSIKVTSEGVTIPVISNGTITGLYDGNAINMNVEIETDFSEITAMLGEDDGLSANDLVMLSLFQDIKVEYILNIAEDKMYVRSSLLSMAMNMSADAWLAIDLAEISGENEFDELANSIISTGETPMTKDLISLFLSDLDLRYTSALTEITETLAIVDSICSDSSFVKNGDTYTNVYTYEEDETSATFQLTLNMNNDEVVAYSMSLKASYDSMNMSVEYSIDEKNKMIMDIIVIAPEELEVTLNMTVEYMVTTDKPTGAPEDGSVIIEDDELNSYF